MDAVCRICMDNSVALVDIFEEGTPSAPSEKPSLADMLNECAGCKVKLDDPLPKQICDTCVLDCLNAFRFKRTSQQSHERLMEMLSENEQKEEGNMQVEAKEDWQWSDKSLDLDCVKIENPSHSASSDEELVPDDKLETPHSELKIIATASWQGKIVPIESPPPLTGKIYCCKLCGKEFLHLDKLDKHQRLHDNELRPYKCPYCPLIFARNYLLKTHLNTHPHSRPIKCPYCPKTFTRQLQAKEHIFAHKGIHLYQCEKCSKKFKSLPGFRGHVCRGRGCQYMTVKKC